MSASYNIACIALIREIVQDLRYLLTKACQGFLYLICINILIAAENCKKNSIYYEQFQARVTHIVSH